MIVVGAPTPEDTRRIGRALAGLSRPGDIIVLAGSLGAGKTVLAAGIGEGMGISEPLTSPSFVLARHYRDGFMPLLHADVYRIGSYGEFEDLDLIEESRDGVLLIEWGDVVAGRLPDIHLSVEIEGAGAEPRTIRFCPSGDWLHRPLESAMNEAARGVSR